MPDQIIPPEQRAQMLQMLGAGQANLAGQQVNAPARAAAIEAGVQGQPPAPPPQTPMGGPAMQPAQGGPQQPGLGGPQQGYMPQGIPKQNGGRMTPEQAKKLAEMLRNR